MFLKRFAPTSLFGRFLLIIIIPGIVLPLVTTYMFYERHWKSVNKHMTASLAGEVALLVDMLRSGKTLPTQKTMEDAKKFLALNIKFIKKLPLPKANTPQPYEFIELQEQIEKRLQLPTAIYYSNNDNDITIAIRLSAKSVLSISTSRKRIENPTTFIFIFGIVITSFILLTIAILFSKNQIRAITRLAQAAEKFGKGMDVSINFKPEGAKEVRQAGIAFIKMKERIKRHVNQRTEMLAGISHDLRTPLTRMKLELALLGDNPEIAELKTDVEDMEHLVNEYLAFTRGEGKEEIQIVNLHDITADIITSYRNDSHLTAMIPPGLTLPLKPRAFKRSLTNLIDNGLKYGQHVTITANQENDHMMITIDDDGPGIPEEERENVFRPFYRLESSRNSDTGGTGLGMAIARDLINNHGGELILSESPQGGLRAAISLPL